jgi:hypothetical protein
MDSQLTTKPIRDGFHAITPYLFTHGASRLIEFISAAFRGEVTLRKSRPDGAINDSLLLQPCVHFTFSNRTA